VVVSGAAHGKLTKGIILNRLKYSVIFIVYVQCTNMAAGRIIQLGWPRIGDLCFRGRYRKLYLDTVQYCLKYVSANSHVLIHIYSSSEGSLL